MMVKTTWADIINRISEDDKINFIAEAMTPLHVLGIEALIVHLNNLGIECKGYILAVSHGETGMGLSESSFHTQCYTNISVMELEPPKQEKVNLSKFYQRLKVNQSGTDFFYATPFRPSFRNLYDVYRAVPDRKISVYITEEGGASYARSPYEFRKYLAINWGFRDYFSFFYHGLVQEKRYEKKLVENGVLKRFLLLKREDDKWVANPECAAAYRVVLESEDSKEDYSNFEDAVIFSPTLLLETGILVSRQDIEIYKSIQDILGTGKYIVKPHPREKNIKAYDELNCEIEQRNGVSQESIFAHLNHLPRFIIGESSTTLIYASVLFNIKSIAINKLIDKENLTDKDYFRDFNRTFGNIVYIPNTMDELADYLK